MTAIGKLEARWFGSSARANNMIRVLQDEGLDEEALWFMEAFNANRTPFMQDFMG